MAASAGRFVTARVIHHGLGALDRLEEEVRKLGGRHPVLLTDAGVLAAGLREHVAAAARLELPWYAEIPAEPPYEVVEACARFLREQKADLVVALGGGSVIDTAKMTALLVVNGGHVSDYFGVDRVPKPGLPVIAIPTTAGTGSEVSPASVFVDPAGQAKKGVRSDYILPSVAILDPALTETMPQTLTASTGVDALTHAIECYTAPRATLVSDMAAERAIALIGEHLRTAYAKGSDLAAREGMLMGSLLAGMALAIANVGIVHALAQAMGGRFHVPHGVANALLLPHGMSFNRIGCRAKYARVAALLGERVEGLSLEDASRRAITAVRALTGDLGLPQRLRDIGLAEEALAGIASCCLETQGRIAHNNPRSVSVAEAEAILRAAY